jgi:hypothetical protein
MMLRTSPPRRRIVVSAINQSASVASPPPDHRESLAIADSFGELRGMSLAPERFM